MKLLSATILAASLFSISSLAAAPAAPAQPKAAAPAAAGKIGGAAAKIDGLEYVKGTFDGVFKPGTVYVVEFWATWCPPCRKSIPHVSSLQKKYGDKVVMIGISNEEVGKVRTFVEAQKEMEYIVAVAGPQSRVYNDYMKAFNQRGIPCAFIVGKDGKIAWVGHPMGMDEVLEETVNK